MTYSLSDDCIRLLRPERFHSVRSICDDPAIVPDSAGIYGWWFSNVPADVPVTNCVKQDGRTLLYVGIAPRGPSTKATSKQRTLRDRLKNHCRGPIRTSTLRRTLVCLLTEEFFLKVSQSAAGKPKIGHLAERKLTDWLDASAKVAFVTTPLPWHVEAHLLTDGPSLPLNIKGSAHPFAVQLKRMRASLGKSKF